MATTNSDRPDPMNQPPADAGTHPMAARSASPWFSALSGCAGALAAAASSATLAWAGAFPPPPDGAFNGALAEARGWSAVTLMLALPALAVAVASARRGSARALPVAIGVNGYLAYTYLEMATSPPFTALYLVYIGAFAFALAALGVGAASLPAATLAPFARLPRRATIAYCAVFAFGLTLAWGKDIVTRTMAGDFGWPSGIAQIGHVVHALDLGLQVPLGIATAILLALRKPAGPVLAMVTLTNAVVMGFALSAMVGVSLLEQGKGVLGALPFASLPLAALTLLALAFRPAQAR